MRYLQRGGGAAPQEIERAVNELVEGRSNAVQSVTLTAGATSTTFSKSTINSNAQAFLTPRTANAAAAVATTFVSNVVAGTITITHANNAQTDRTFGVLIIGG